MMGSDLFYAEQLLKDLEEMPGFVRHGRYHVNLVDIRPEDRDTWAYGREYTKIEIRCDGDGRGNYGSLTKADEQIFEAAPELLERSMNNLSNMICLVRDLMDRLADSEDKRRRLESRIRRWV